MFLGGRRAYWASMRVEHPGGMLSTSVTPCNQDWGTDGGISGAR